MTGREFLAWFVAQPQSWCATCRHWNEVNPPAWWRGNCHHAARLSNDADQQHGGTEG